jgi:DnaJ family protein C protein 28
MHRWSERVDPEIDEPMTPAARGRANVDQSGRAKDARHFWAGVAEEQIRAAQERGEFDNLPGSGKPLQLDVNPWAGDRALAYSLLKANGIAPPEIERGREVDAEHARADALMAALRRRRDDLASRRVSPFPSERRAYNILRVQTEARYAEILRAANSKALALNISAPAPLHRPIVDVEARLHAFHEEFPPLAE